VVGQVLASEINIGFEDIVNTQARKTKLHRSCVWMASSILSARARCFDVVRTRRRRPADAAGTVRTADVYCAMGLC